MRLRESLGLAKSATPPGGLSIASPSVHRQVPHFGCTAWFRCVRSSKIAQDSPDAFRETLSVPRQCDHRMCRNNDCFAGCDAACSRLSGASSCSSRAGCPWPAGLQEQLQLLPWLGRQGRRNGTEPGSCATGARRSTRRAHRAGRPERDSRPRYAKTHVECDGDRRHRCLVAQPAAVRSWHAQPLDILVGNAKEGEAYFNGAGHCTQCHAGTGDLAGIGARYEPKMIQNLIVSGGGGGSFGRRSASAAAPKVPPTTVTVTLPSGQTITGDLDHISAFVVALRTPDGTYRSFARHDAIPKVVVTNPVQWHIDMLPKWRDSDIHNLTAYLATLK